jgi:membrane protein implicated in regulation of membrane protease activity
MAVLASFDFSQPVWLWLALAALVLAIEVVTGTGWLLWPSVSAMVTGGIAAFNPPFGWPGQIVVFAVLTIASTLASRRFLPPPSTEGPDLNDQSTRLIGAVGTAADDFVAGHGRVLVGGAEWVAQSADALPLIRGARVTVEAVEGGSRLTVRPIS